MAFNIRKYLPSLSFIRGFGSIIDITGTYFMEDFDVSYLMRKDLTPQQQDALALRQDALALRGDWERVGGDLEKAIKKVKTKSI
jgi:hypothetical protein